MSPPEFVDDAINPPKLSSGKLTGGDGTAATFHTEGFGRGPNSAQSQVLLRRPHLRGVDEGYGFNRGEKAVRNARGLLRMRRCPA